MSLPTDKTPCHSSAENDLTSISPASSITLSESTLPDPPTLSDEQESILRSAVHGGSLFFTGGAGTGKSFLLKEIIRALRHKFARVSEAVAVTSPTGIAASLIGGTTIHSFSGVGLGLETAEVLAEKIRYNTRAMTRWRKVKVLVIDEVSMLDGILFDKLSQIACMLRNSTEPFGGVQLILTGDFFQLPPVSKSGLVKFAFEAKVWDSLIKQTYSLEKVYRQRDEEFAAMLKEVRFGQLSSDTINRFHSLTRPLTSLNGVEPTELFPLRRDVDRANLHRLDQLTTPRHEYIATEGGTVENQDERARLLSSILPPTRLTLRVGAQVMLTKNTDQELVNGTIGRIIAFNSLPGPADAASSPNEEKPPVYPLVSFRLANGRFRDVLVEPQMFKIELPTGEIRAFRTQLPLILAWAISIHKAQGQTLDFVKVDLNKVFEKGQVYVALSCATTLDGLQVLNFEPSMVKAHPRVTKWTASFNPTMGVNS